MLVYGSALNFYGGQREAVRKYFDRFVQSIQWGGHGHGVLEFLKNTPANSWLDCQEAQWRRRINTLSPDPTSSTRSVSSWGTSYGRGIDRCHFTGLSRLGGAESKNGASVNHKTRLISAIVMAQPDHPPFHPERCQWLPPV